MDDKIEKYYDKEGNATHYDSDRINCIHQTERIWGTEALMMHFEIVVFEYKYRLGKKDSDSVKQQLLKIKWYENAISYLEKKINEGSAIQGIGPGRHGLPEELKNNK